MLNDLLIIISRTFIGYFILIVLMRIMGKREIGELGVFDAIILMSLGNMTILGIENYDENYIYWIIPIIILTIIQKVISFITLKFQKARKYFDGNESIVIYKGKLVIPEMRKNQYNLDDLLSQLRLLQIRTIEEVEYAFLESNGKLSAFTYEEQKKKIIFPLPLIVSGEIQTKNLNLINKSNEWLLSELKILNKEDLKKIFCAIYENNQVKIIETINLKKI